MSQDPDAKREDGGAEREDLRVLAVRRAREPSEEGHERLTQAMQELL